MDCVDTDIGRYLRSILKCDATCLPVLHVNLFNKSVDTDFRTAGGCRSLMASPTAPVRSWEPPVALKIEEDIGACLVIRPAPESYDGGYTEDAFERLGFKRSELNLWYGQRTEAIIKNLSN